MSPPPFPPHGSGLKGFLKMHILHTLAKRPQSGYEIIAEIKEKTEGGWIPSKGAVYPVLSSLEREGLIRVKSVGARSKRIYHVTVDGLKIIGDMRKHMQDMNKHIGMVHNLILVEIEENEGEIGRLAFDIRSTTLQLEGRQKQATAKILSECLSKLQKLSTPKIQGKRND
ncbi:MAG: PadR family transcriptional regulator [Candidatus Altiarchaeota archaeon]